MQTRDVTKLQYEKGQQIKAADVNARMKEAFGRFNIMGPTDVAPLTTGQFRVFEPRKGLKLVPAFNVNTKWYPDGVGAVIDVDSYTCSSSAADFAMILGTVAGPTPLAILEVAHRYQVYFFVHNDSAQAGTIKIFNDSMADYTVYSAPIAGNADLTATFSFVAITRYFGIGGRSGAMANMNISVRCPFEMGGVAQGIYIYDWTDNMWLIPNYCGFMSPSTDNCVTTLGDGPIDLRSNHYLMCLAIKKEIDAANEVLKYL